jgi:hypothetical protein
MKSLKSLIAVIVSIIATLCILSSCVLEPPQAVPGATDAPLEGGDNTGRVLISIAAPGVAAASRTLLPEWVGLNYKLEFTRQGETEPDPALTQTITTATAEQDLDPGVVYALKVSAYKTDPAVIAAQGIVPGITAQANQTLSVTAPLVLNKTGTGILNYAVTFSEGITLAGGTLTLYPLSYRADPTYIELNSGPSGEKTIPSGHYRARLLVYGSAGGAVKFTAKTEVLHINDSLTTRASYALSAGDFTDTGLVGDKLYIAENLAQLQGALNSISAAAETVFTILISNDISSPPLTLSAWGYDGKTIILRGSGGVREISLSSSGSLFTIGGSSGPTLMLRDIALKGRADNNAALVKLVKGELIMEANSVVTGNTASYLYSSSSPAFSTLNCNGGGVFVSGGTFTMRDNASVKENVTTTTNNAGFYSYGGGVFVLEGAFIMQDNASVSGNTAQSSFSTYTTSSRSYGGGVYIAGGSVVAEGSASINDNTASASTHESHGGGVYVGGGSFAINSNASVRGNRAVSSSSATIRGGGVHVANGASFTMQGEASISGNTASGDPSFSVGGGVYIANGGTLSKTGGVIYGANETGTDSDGGNLKNTALTYESSAVYYHLSSARRRNTTVGPDQDLSTGNLAVNWND